MYLNRLNEEQKNLFIDLCIHASLANNNFADEEKNMIDLYCEEMNLKEHRYTANNSMDDAVSKLVAISTNEELRIVLLEISALIISDNVYDNDEQNFMNSLVERIGFSEDKVSEMMGCLNELTAVYNRLNMLVFG
ncbi:MAG: hypothetical protein PUI48_06765 [Oscillospiraceae bacterium]|nr:hypothetical protein [Oscillospiraceae bacterium]MDY6207910.1 hypothetical protein [Oscillospiraceae bacterium]